MEARGRQTRTRQEFDHFVTGSVDGLLRAAYLIAWDFDEAEDLVQECLFRIARRWPRVSRMEHPGAYARKVLVNVALDESRQRSRHRAELGRSGAHPTTTTTTTTTRTPPPTGCSGWSRTTPT